MNPPAPVTNIRVLTLLLNNQLGTPGRRSSLALYECQERVLHDGAQNTGTTPFYLADYSKNDNHRCYGSLPAREGVKTGRISYLRTQCPLISIANSGLTVTIELSRPSTKLPVG